MLFVWFFLYFIFYLFDILFYRFDANITAPSKDDTLAKTTFVIGINMTLFKWKERFISIIPLDSLQKNVKFWCVITLYLRPNNELSFFI